MALKPHNDETKALYALFGAGAITGIISLIWVTTLPSRLAEMTEVQQNTIEDTSTETDSFKTFIQDTKQQLGSLIGSGVATDEVQPENELDPKTALGSLGNNEAGDMDYYVPTPESDSQRQLPENDSALGALSSASTTEREVQKAEPRTILIGTTTSKGDMVIE